MKDYLLLLRVNLKSMLRGAFTEGLRDERGKLRIGMIVLCAIGAVGLLAMAAMIIVGETFLYKAAATVGLAELLIGLAVLLSMVVTLLFGLFHTMGAMYFNRDTANSAYLPISQRTQMAARWTEIYTGEVLFSLVLLLPLFINHGIFLGAEVGYYLTIAVVLLTTPLYPLTIALLLASLLAQLTSITKHKEVWVVIGTLLLLGCVLGLEWTLLPQIPDDADAGFFLGLIMDNQALLNFIVGAFPPVMWAVKAVGGSGSMLALYAGVGIAAIAAVIWLMGSFYLKTCLKHTEHGTARKTAVKGSVSFDAASPLRAIFCREMNEILKTPVYLMNAVLGVLMMPIMLIAMSVGVSSSMEEGITLTMVMEELLSMVSPMDLTLILTAFFSVMLFVCPITATAVSREGKRLPIVRMIPVSPRIILWAKLLVGLAIIGIGSVLMGVGIVILLGLRFLPHVVTAVVMVNVLSTSVGIGSITIDVLRPVLTWKNENEVMKQNMNTMFAMLVYVALLALVAVPVGLLYAQAPWVRMAVAAAILLAELLLSLLLMRKVAEPCFARLEP